MVGMMNQIPAPKSTLFFSYLIFFRALERHALDRPEHARGLGFHLLLVLIFPIRGVGRIGGTPREGTKED